MQKERELMKQVSYYARVTCHDVGGLLIDLDDVIRSHRHADKKNELMSAITNELLRKTEMLYTTCCRMAGRGVAAIPLFENGAELAEAVRKGEL